MDKRYRRNPPAAGPWLVLAAAVLWGTTGTTQALAPTGAEPAAIGAIRLAVGGVALVILALARGSLRRAGRWPLLATLAAAGGMALYQLCFFAGVARAGVALGTMVGIGSAPIWGGLLGFLVRGERPGRRWLAATSLALAGCALLTLSPGPSPWQGEGGRLSSVLVGVLLALGAGASYAVYTVASKELLDGRSPEAVVAVVFGLGALLLSPVLFMADLDWLVSGRGLAVALHLGILTVAVAYLLFARGLAQVRVATATTLTLAEPLTAATLGVVVLGERLGAAGWLGAGLLLGGLCVLFSTKDK